MNKIKWLSIIVLMIFAYSCNPPSLSIPTTSLPVEQISRHTSTVRPFATLRLTDTIVPSPTASQTASVTPNLIDTPNPTATDTPSPTPDLTLEELNPTSQQVTKYLNKIYGPAFHTDPKVHLIYQDLDGDGQNEIIYNNMMEVAVLFREGNGYRARFSHRENIGKLGGSSRIAFEDWTNDGIPEIVFDSMFGWSSSDTRDVHWYRTVVHCSLGACSEVWSNVTAYAHWDSYFSGMHLEQTMVERPAARDGETTIQVEKTAFQLGTTASESDPEYFDFNYTEMITSTRIFTQTLSTFTWNGEEFGPGPKQAIRPFRKIIPRSVLTSQNDHGDEASVGFEPFSLWDDGLCQLRLNGQPLGEQFLCKKSYTLVSWQDVTADQNPEMIVKTTAAEFYAMNPECVYEHLMIYTVNGSVANEVANLIGCINNVNEGIFGIQVTGGHTSPAVITATNEQLFTPEECFWTDEKYSVSDFCWYELAPLQIRTFIWNGSRFVEQAQ